MKNMIKKLLPVGILLFSVGGYLLMQFTAVEPAVITPKKKEVTAEYIVANEQEISLVVHSQGEVVPAIQTDLMAEVGGTIITIADGLQTGGLFRKGEMLLQIDPREYQDVVTEAEAELARAQSQLTKEEAHARQAEKNWKLLGRGKPSQLALRVPQLVESKATVRAATAHLNRAKRNLEKTRITAPYDLLVHNRDVDLHGYVLAGTLLIQVSSVDAVDIRLPVTERQLSMLELPAPSLTSTAHDGSEVILSSITKGQNLIWQANIVRAENIYSPKSRVTHVIARVIDPYGLRAEQSRPILAVGMFVLAEIKGRVISDRIIIPAQALHNSEGIWIIRDDNTLTQRKVSQLYTQGGLAVISEGIRPGERVCVAGVEFATENLTVRPVQSAETLLVGAGVNYEK